MTGMPHPRRNQLPAAPGPSTALSTPLSQE